eukprot:TRINITY_DN30421_c0_g1_i2.p1 TRINITY_DN30421_c0_g1~~TRINITY_DN30421_c0_g1_i2.p1  ORF type:complete len:519 (+),score=75.56 TRINITY_DN30421_c0_g1_i2:96-1559(+)
MAGGCGSDGTGLDSRCLGSQHFGEEHLRCLQVERRVEIQMRSCFILERNVCKAAEVLASAGKSLQSGSPQQANELAVLFSVLGLDAPPVARACQQLFDGFGSLGSELEGLAGSLTGNLLTPLRKLQATLEADHARKARNPEEPEGQRSLDASALMKGAQKSVNAPLKLQRISRDRPHCAEACCWTGGRAALQWLRRSTFFRRKKTSEVRSTRALQARAATASCVASCSDASLSATLERERRACEMCQVLGDFTVKRRELLEKSLSSCAESWGRTSALFAGVESQFREIVSELVDLERVSSPSTSAMTAKEVSVAAAQARLCVPKLCLESFGGGPGGKAALSVSESESCSVSGSSSRSSTTYSECLSSGRIIPFTDGESDSVGRPAPGTARLARADVSLPDGTLPSLLQPTRQASFLSKAREAEEHSVSHLRAVSMSGTKSDIPTTTIEKLRFLLEHYDVSTLVAGANIDHGSGNCITPGGKQSLIQI